MNSMFSCFDALCAELLLAKTLRTSFSSSSQPNTALIRNDKATEKVAGNGELPPEKKVKKQQLIRSAPEFDGLNCFETFVRY